MTVEMASFVERPQQRMFTVKVYVGVCSDLSSLHARRGNRSWLKWNVFFTSYLNLVETHWSLVLQLYHPDMGNRATRPDCNSTMQLTSIWT